MPGLLGLCWEELLLVEIIIICIYLKYFLICMKECVSLFTYLRYSYFYGQYFQNLAVIQHIT